MQFLRGRKLNLAVAFACCLGISMILSCSDEASSGREQGQTDIPLEERESWKDVQEAVEEGRPRTAKKLLKPIIEKALNEKEYDTATRAIGLKARLEAQIQGNKPTAMIVELEDEIGVAPQPMRPIMHVFLADWYWEYYRQNKLRFWQRTKTDKSSAEEIWSWDLPRVFSAIDKNLHCALAAKAFLQQTPVEQYSNLLQKGRMPDRYRPTLYDFAVQEAIEFYCSGEQAAVKPLDAFVLQAKSPVFDSLKEFLNWDIKTTDQDSRLYKAVRLYQDVLRFHRQAGNKDALIDWNLHRLRLGYNKEAGEEKAERYKMALRRFVRLNRGHEISVRAQYRLA
ncbi:MAG: hypothetical protein KGZ25_08380, partial [Planctomycetes bacterium]|nr:hypothetical protein [Planctomycetota bacterium]